MTDLIKCQITNIHRRKERSATYADLRGMDGQLFVAATLDYILDRLEEKDSPYDCQNAIKA